MPAYNFQLDGSAPKLELILARVGAQGPAGADGNAGDPQWIDYALSYSSTPVFNTVFNGGDVYTYKYNNDTLTLYRYISPTEDAFYDSFDGLTLGNLLANKQITL